MKRTMTLSVVFTLLAAIGYFGMPGMKSQGQKDTQPNSLHGLNENSDDNSQQRIGYAPAAGGITKTTPISWHGGPVIGTPTIYLIWYGNWNQGNGSDNPGGQQIVRDWARSIGGSPHFRLNSSYSLTTTTVTGNVYFGGETNDTGSQGTTLTDAKVKTVVTNALSAGRLPYNANGIYFVLSSSNVAESSGFCSQYCGWHTAGTANAGKIRYSFVGNTNRCLSSCAPQSISPNSNPGVDGMISVITHELEEATSDPDLNGWYDASGAENADKCAWTFGHYQYQVGNGSWANMRLGTRDFLIQRNLQRTTSGDFCKVDASRN